MKEFWIAGGIVLFVAVCALIVYFRGRILKIVPYTVTIPNLPKSFDGYRFAVISDLHDRVFGAKNKILVEKILKEMPDAVLCAGDMHEGPHSPEPFYDLLAGLAQQVPTYYTEGNHDMRDKRCRVTLEEYEEHMRRICETGTVSLNDCSVVLERNGQSVLLAGQSWRGMRQGRVPDFDPTIPSVMVCHDPLQFDHPDPLPDLLISGHVHGGILRLPFIGAVFAPGNGAPLYKRFGPRYFFPKYSRGLYQKGTKTLAVTQGLGFAILPIRLIPPEIMIVQLKSGKIGNDL